MWETNYALFHVFHEILLHITVSAYFMQSLRKLRYTKSLNYNYFLLIILNHYDTIVIAYWDGGRSSTSFDSFIYFVEFRFFA